MASQTELFPSDPPVVAAGEVALLMKVLAGRGWMTAQQIAAAPEFAESFEGVKNTDRKIRAIANKTEGLVLSYPGSPGYRLTREATIEEIQTATAKLRHQAGEMSHRALEIDRVYHGKK